MYNYKRLCSILFITTLSFGIVVCYKEWIDPHDMNIKKLPASSESVLSNEKCECASHSAKSESVNTHSTINYVIAHYKRAINMILAAVVKDHLSISDYKGQLYINIIREDYDELSLFARAHEDVEDASKLRKIDKILSTILTKSTHERLIDAFISWTDWIYFTCYNRTVGVLAACLFVLFISYKLLRANITLWAVTKYLIFLAWVTDFSFTWINLLQEAEINNMADSFKYSTVPSECDPHNMSAWQYIKFLCVGSYSCRDYHRTIYKNHFWSIGPIMVLSHQVGILVFTPAQNIGAAIGSFTSGIMGQLPWGVNIVLLPVLLVLSVTIFCVLCSFWTRTSFRFNFFHVLQLEFGNEQRRAVGDVLSGRNLSAIMNVLHRDMIEDVRQANTAENAVTSEVSDFREAVEAKAECETTTKTESDKEKQTKESDTSESKDVRAHDGSGDMTSTV